MTTSIIARPELTVSEVARDSGVTPSAVRFYEKHGLITAERTSGNQRRFTADAPCRIRVARVAQRVGLSVAEIRGILNELPEDPQLDDWRRFHDQLVGEAERRIASLRATLADISSGRKLCEL